MKYPRITLLFLFSFIVLLSCKKDDEGSINDPKAENRKGLGISAEDLLSDDIYDKLIVELVYPASYAPTGVAKQNIVDFLNERLNKSGGISIVETVIQAPPGAPFGISEIKAIEDDNRTRYTTPGTMAVYIFFSNGSSANDSNTTVTLGTAYLNTSIVVYEKTLRDLVNQNPNFDITVLETTTLQHEFSHILGLVNIQNDDIHTTHEDEAHAKHCSVAECLMYFESTSGRSITEYFENRSLLPTLDPLCIADLQAKGGK